MSKKVLFFVAAAVAAAQSKVDFQKQIQPLLAEKCLACHGAQVQQAGLRLDARQPALRGGDYGPVILPGNSAGSKLIRRVVNGDGGLQMPPTGALASDEIALLRAWIDQGVEWRIDVPAENPVQATDPKVAGFIRAVRSGDVKAAEKLIAADPGMVKAKDANGSTVLHHAAGFGSYAMVELLVAKGADANAANRMKSTPLFWAMSDERKVRLLVEHGADVNAKQAEGRTPVYQAAFQGNGAAVLRYLLAQGAQADVKTIAGFTPLMAAAGQANVAAMRLLLEKGAKATMANEAGVTALMAAAATGNTEAVRLLLAKGPDVNAETKRRHTALADAATAGVEETVKLLLEAGAKVDVPDDRGYTALLYAAGSDAIPAGVVRMLLAKGANPQLKGDGETAAELAAKRGDTEVARLLGVSEKERIRLGVAAQPAGSGVERTVAAAVRPALALLEKQSYNFIRTGGCNSCHAQDLPSAAAALARERGLPAPERIAKLPPAMQPLNAERLMDLPSLGLGNMMWFVTWQMFDAGMNHAVRDEYSDAVVRYVKAMQRVEGNWWVGENRRPPMNAGGIQTVALAVNALMKYGPEAEKADTDRTVARAAAWLEAAKPVTNQDRAFQVLGLAWAGRSGPELRAPAKALAAAQRPDGGWSQMTSMGSDAYATGEALYALYAGGAMPVSDAVYRKGVAYLMRTQAADGSWHVASRSIWLQPYFESGFPHGHDQWISAAGTAWATMALAVTVPKETPASLATSRK